MAIVFVAIAGIASISVFSWWNSRKGIETPPPEFNTYSENGFIFQYPRDMSISEEGTLESIATFNSGRIVGELKNSEYEAVALAWLVVITHPDMEDLEEALNASFESMEAVSPIDRGQLVTTEKAGDAMIYRYFNTTIGGEPRYGISSCWFCDTCDRSFHLIVIHSGQNVLQIFERYLDSFIW